MREHGDIVSIEVVRLLSEARRERGLTMEEVAERAGVDRTYIGLLERGERRPTVAAVASICSALGLTLSNLMSQVEGRLIESQRQEVLSTSATGVELVARPPRRIAPRDNLRTSTSFSGLTGLQGVALVAAIETAYHTLDLIDEQLVEKNSEPLARLVELANLSSILGNLLASGLAEVSNGLYQRNGPHKYPDLLASNSKYSDLEVKTALESNRPKGHLPKAGAYVTFRYVLCDRSGNYRRGPGYRGDLVVVWEARFGVLGTSDFAISSTAGDSGKTAVIKTTAFNAMEIVYFDPARCPAPRLAAALSSARANQVQQPSPPSQPNQASSTLE